MLAWLRFHISGARPDGRRLLSPAVQLELYAIQMPIPHPAGPAGYTMGWMRGIHERRLLLSHEGGEFGASTFALICPDEQIGVAVLLSRRAAACVRYLAYGLRDRLLGITADRRKEFLDLDRAESDAAAAELARSYAPESGAPVPDLTQLSGIYRSPHSGLLSLAVRDNQLRAEFSDVDFCNCRLEPLGGEIFRVTDFDEPGMGQEVRGEARMRIAIRNGRAHRVETPGLGCFDRIAATRV